MSNKLDVRVVESPRELRSLAAAWDDLWCRSEVRTPSARANLIALWAEHFLPHGRFRAVAVEQAGQLVAALPLVGQRVLRTVAVDALPCNDWAASGDLLLDPNADTDAALETLLMALAGIGRHVFHFERVAFETERWQLWRASLERSGWFHYTLPQHAVGQVEINHDWETYLAARKGRHRQRWRRCARLLEKEGDVCLRVYSEVKDEEADALLQRGFEVEDRSWKGQESTSVLKTPGMLNFYQHEARELAMMGHVELVFLELRDRPIAFCYGWKAKDTRFCIKLGYDEAYAKYGPGQQQILRLLKQVHADPECHVYDFCGQLLPWSEGWSTTQYPVGRLIFGPPRLRSRVLGGCCASAVVWGKAIRKWVRKIP
jgi:CelD/BcsL family acetyltransferase involved in cellulose biosynthesis